MYESYDRLEAMLFPSCYMKNARKNKKKEFTGVDGKVFNREKQSSCTTDLRLFLAGFRSLTRMFITICF